MLIVLGEGVLQHCISKKLENVKHKIVWPDITQQSEFVLRSFPYPFFFFLSTLMSDVKRAMTDISSSLSVDY
jgi:hypothetical protein